jgi:hypothetical protein
MSIEAIPENTLGFPNGFNVRIAIAGLATCKFASPTSTIRFLRHVDKHRLELKVKRIPATGVPKYDPPYLIEKSFKTISIDGAEQVVGYEHQNLGPSEFKLKRIVNLPRLHGHTLKDKSGSPFDELTIMSITHCLFYTRDLTKLDHVIVKNHVSTGRKAKFGEILGGYMKIGANKEVKITIPGLIGSPIRLPENESGVKYTYEIEFNNSCFEADNKPCPYTFPTDFLRIYDVLQDDVDPKDKFDLLRELTQEEESNTSKKKGRPSITSTDTGACLPVVEDPPIG